MSDNRRIIDGGRLWAGGLLAGVVAAAGIAVVGLLVLRGILDIPVLVRKDGKLVNANTWWYALGAFGAALLATGLLHVLLIAAPKPYTFYGWLLGLAVAVAVLAPYTTKAELSSKVATSLLNFAIGVAIASIVAGVGRTAARVLDEPSEYPGGPATGW